MTEDEARDALLMGSGGVRLDVQKGHEVVVIRGRRVPLGTRGVVRWMGDSDFGPRLGIVVPGDNKLTYTYLKNVVIVYPGFDPSEKPVEGWEALYKRSFHGNSHRPRRGHLVKCRESGKVGTVFWVRGDRLGFKMEGGEVVWCLHSEADHMIIQEDLALGSDQDYQPTPYDPPLPLALPHRSPEKWKGLLSSLPSPFCDIRSFERVDNGYRAMDADGVVVCTMPDASVPQLLAGR
jgi:hypothetical protein